MVDDLGAVCAAEYRGGSGELVRVNLWGVFVSKDEKLAR